jgi:hypothetical protein
MENYAVVTELKLGPNKTDDCIFRFIQNDIEIFHMQFHWIDVESASKDFSKLPDLIKRLNNVLLYGDSTYRTTIDKIQISICSNDIIKFWIATTHYYTLSFKINESLMIAFKHLYNWYHRYRTIYEESPPSTMLVENDASSCKFFGESYRTVKIPKIKLKDKLIEPYDV